VELREADMLVTTAEEEHEVDELLAGREDALLDIVADEELLTGLEAKDDTAEDEIAEDELLTGREDALLDRATDEELLAGRNDTLLDTTAEEALLDTTAEDALLDTTAEDALLDTTAEDALLDMAMDDELTGVEADELMIVLEAEDEILLLKADEDTMLLDADKDAMELLEAMLEVRDMETDDELEITESFLYVLNEPILQNWPSKACGLSATYFLHESMELSSVLPSGPYCLGQPD
jgi:hypothetical protein